MAPRVNDLEPIANMSIIRRPSAIGPPWNQGKGSDIDQALVNEDGWSRKNATTKRMALWDAIRKEEETIRTQIKVLEKARGRELTENEYSEARKEGANAFRRAYRRAVSDCLVNDTVDSGPPPFGGKGAGRQRARR